MCEQLLDYIYGELDEAQKQAFEAHLPSCARCQPEVASLGRTRQAAKRLMPAVEPPANLTGALHAQLMHAASQRRPKRGVVLQLFRRVAQHPQMAAAAMFLVVGGAFMLAWRKGKVLPPSPSLAETPIVESAKPAEPVTAFDKMAANQPTGTLPDNVKGIEPAAKTEKELLDDHLQLAEGAGGAKNKEATPALYEGGKVGKLVLQTPPATYNVNPSAKHHAAGKSLRSIAKDEGDDLKLKLASDELNGAGTVAGGPGSGRGDAPKSSAPATPAYGRAQSSLPSQAAAPPPPPSSVPPEAANSEVARQAAPSATPAASPPALSSRDSDSRFIAREKAPVQKPAATTTATANVESNRKQFYELAKSNRCDEAIKLFQDLERTTQFISPNERAQYVRCLMQKGRQQEAEQQLIELKADKQVTNGEVQKLQEELDGARPKTQPAHRAEKKAKAAPPAAEYQASEPSAPAPQAQQAPAPAAPPPAATTSAPAKSRAKKSAPAVY
jgi:hypothetical protein